MPDDLTPKIITLADTFRLEPGGMARPITRLAFMLGRFGPFEHTFETKPQGHEIDAVIAERRMHLEGRV